MSQHGMTLREWAAQYETRTVLLLIFLVVFTAAGIAQSGNLLAASNPDLEAEYRFDTGAGTTAHDTSDNGNDGTLTNFDFNATSGWGDGKYGKALQLDGNDDYVEMSDAPFDISSEITMTAWVKPDKLENSVIINKLGSNAGYRFIVRSDSLQFSYGDGSTLHHHGITDGINTGEWSFVAITWDGSTLSGYVNGRRWTQSLSDTWAENDKNLAIVGPNPGGLGGDRYDGTIDDVRIYDRALNASEVRGIASQGKVRFGKETEQREGRVLDMGFGRQNSTHVFDTSGEYNHGEAVNGAAQETAAHCKVGRCYTFDGTDDYVNISSFPSLGTSDQPYTIMTWLYAAGSESNGNIIHMSGGADGTNWCGPPLNLDNGRIEAWSWDGSAVTVQSDAIDTGRWYHAATSWNGSHLHLFVNGRRVATTPQSTYSASGGANYLWPAFTPNGCSNDQGWFNGRIDQVKAFDRALSQQEIIQEARKLEQDGAVLSMPFDAAGGDTAHDVSRYGNDGTLQPNESWGPAWSAGAKGPMLLFDGGDDAIDVSDSPSLSPTEGVSFGAWINLEDWDSSTNPGNSAHHLYKSGSFGLSTSSSSGRLNGWITDGGTRRYANGGTVPLNEWTHVLVTYDGSTVRNYINGEIVAETSYNGDIDDSSSVLRIGNAGGFSWGTDGNMSHPVVYPYALSSEQAASLYRGGSFAQSGDSDGGTDGPGRNKRVLDLSFDNYNGSHMLDGSGAVNHGVFGNSPERLMSGPCRVGRCIDFEDNSGYVRMGDVLGFEGWQDYTVAFWAKPNASGGSYPRLISKEDSGDRSGWNILRSNSGDTLNYERRASDGSWSGGMSIGYTPDEWQHFVYTFDNDTGTGYLNGQQVTSTGGLGKVGSSSNPLDIGQRPGGSGGWDGPVDQFIIYNRTLTDDEVWQLYTQGRDSGQASRPGPVGRWSFDAGPRVCILNEAGFNNGGWNAPSATELQNTLEGEGWSTTLVGVDDITQDGYEQCEVIVFPDGENYPGFDTSSDFCNTVNGEGGEHDVFAEMKEFMQDGGLWVGTWGAGLWYPNAKNSTGWFGYQDRCSQYSGDSLYSDGGGSRCSDLGYSCYTSGTYNYTNIDQSTAPALPGTVTGTGMENYRWASSLSRNYLQAYDGASPVSGRFVGLQKVGRGWYFHMGSNTLFDPSQYGNADDAWNNLLTWYAGNGGQSIWDVADDNDGNISGDNNAPAYSSACKAGVCLEFDGGSDVVEVPDSDKLDIQDGNLTASAWVKIPSGYSPSNHRIIVEKAVDEHFHTSDGPGWGISIDTSGQVYGGVTDAAGSSKWETSKLTDIRDGKWHHVTLVIDNGDSVTVYLDGEEEDTVSLPTVNFNPSVPLGIGASANSNTRHINAEIDDVRVYPYALTQDQVKSVKGHGEGMFN